MLDSIFALAKMVFLESYRKRIIHVFMGICFIFLVWASTYNAFGLNVQTKFLQDTSLFALTFVGLLITLTSTAGLLSNELQMKTVYPLLAKPLSRWQVLVGKFVGALYVIYLNLGVLAVIFLSLLWYRQGHLEQTTIQSLYLVFVECTVTAAICLFFSTFFSTAANVCVTFLIYYLGEIKEIAGTFNHWVLQTVAVPLNNPILPPTYEYFDIKQALIMGIPVSWTYIGTVTLYGIFLAALYLSVAGWIFSRRDL